MSKLKIKPEILLKNLAEQAGLKCKQHYRFHPVRKFEADLYGEINGRKIAIEYEGGQYNPYAPALTKAVHDNNISVLKLKSVLVNYLSKQSGHKISRFKTDADKYNEAGIMGIIVLRFTREHLKDPDNIINTIKRAVNNETSIQNNQDYG